MKTNDTILRIQVLLERVKTGYSRKLLAMLAKAEKAVKAELWKLGVSATNELTKGELQKLLGRVRAAQVGIHSAYLDKQLIELEELAGYSAGLEAKVLRRTNYRIKTGRAVSAADAHRAYVAARTTPIPATGGYLEPFVKGWHTSAIRRVNNTINAAWVNGLTIRETVSDVVRTFGIDRRGGEAMIRTATQHVATAARFETWHANKDLVRGYLWVATLDRRTTSQCRSMDGRRFDLGKGPRPPIHINCRSTTAPVLDKEFDWLDEGATRASMDGPVDMGETYYSWLGKQPAGFQKDVLGPTRYKLFRDGGLDSEAFARLNLDRTYQPLTLAEMKEREPLVFEKAKVEL